MTGQLQTDRRKRKFSFFAIALLKKEKDKKELPSLNFLSGFLCHASFSTFAVYFLLCVEKITHNKKLAKPPTAKELNPSHKTKTPAKKFCLPTNASWTVACILTIFFTVDSFAQLPNPQTPQFGTFEPIQQGKSYNAPVYNSPQQQNSNNPHGSALQPKKADQMIKYGNTGNQIKPQTGYYNPSTENNFNQITPKMRLEREMVDLLRESQYNSSVIGDAKYYNSIQYLKDLPNYTKAKDLIKEMVEDKRALSIKDAYFLAESAYGNLHLTYDEYNKLIKKNANFIQKWLVENGYNSKDPEAIHLGIQKFLSDSPLPQGSALWLYN